MFLVIILMIHVKSNAVSPKRPIIMWHVFEHLILCTISKKTTETTVLFFARNDHICRNTCHSPVKKFLISKDFENHLR